MAREGSRGQEGSVAVGIGSSKHPACWFSVESSDVFLGFSWQKRWRPSFETQTRVQKRLDGHVVSRSDSTLEQIGKGRRQPLSPAPH